MRVLNIIVAFQTLVMEYVDQEDKTNEVDEITEILFLLIKEGKSLYDICQGEYIWKFVIKQNIEVLSKYSKKDKKSLSSRAIFKYVDMAALIKWSNLTIRFYYKTGMNIIHTYFSMWVDNMNQYLEIERRLKGR